MIGTNLHCTRWDRPSPFVICQRVHDLEVDADANHQQSGLNPSVCLRKAGALLWGSLISCGRLAIGPTQGVPRTFAPDRGGSQPPRRLPACPTSWQRSHSCVAHTLSTVAEARRVDRRRETIVCPTSA